MEYFEAKLQPLLTQVTVEKSHAHQDDEDEEGEEGEEEGEGGEDDQDTHKQAPPTPSRIPKSKVSDWSFWVWGKGGNIT